MKSWVVLAAAAILVGVVTQAASQNLSGDWKLNFAKSNYGKFPAPSSMTRKIAHNDPKLTLTTTQKGPQGEVTSKLVYTTDGKESVNQVAGGEAKGIAQWIGDKLMIESSREFQGGRSNRRTSGRSPTMARPSPSIRTSASRMANST